MGIKEDLEQAGDRPGMEELEGQVFQINKAFEIEKEKSTFQEGDYFFANLDIQVEDEDRVYEMQQRFTGRRVIRQLIWIKQENLIPIRVRVCHRPDLAGNPWSLEVVDSNEAAQSEPVEPRGQVATAIKKPTRAAPDALEGFRDKDGKLDGVGFVRFWQDQGYGPDELSEIVGAASASAVEHWFKVNKGKTMNDLLAIAQTNRDNPEELPFE